MSDLIFDVDSAIDRNNPILVLVMFQFVQFVSNLDGQLSGWCQNNSLDPPSSKQLVSSHIFNNWKPKCESFSRPGKISRNDIISLIDRVEAVLLDWKQINVAFVTQHFDCALMNLREARKFTVIRSLNWNGVVSFVLQLANVVVLLVFVLPTLRSRVCVALILSVWISTVCNRLVTKLIISNTKL